MCNNYIYVVFVGGKQITWFLEIVCVFSPHLCVGFLVFGSVSRPPPPPLLIRLHAILHTTLQHTIFHTHTQLCHTPLCHTPSFTYNFVTNQLCHTHTPSFTHTQHTIFHTQLFHTPTLSHAHTQLCHTPSFTYNFVLHNFVTHTSKHNFVTHQLCHTLSFTHQLCHTPSVSHTIFHIQLCHTPLCHTPTLSQTIFHFACQAWHLLTSTFVLRGRHGTYGRIELAFSDGQ